MCLVFTCVHSCRCLRPCAHVKRLKRLSDVLLYHSLPISLGFFFTNPELVAIQLAWWPENPSNLSTPPSLQGLYMGTATPRFYVNLGHLNPDLHAYSANSHTHWNSSPAQSWHFCMTVTVCRILTQAFYLYLIPAVFNMYLCTYVCEAQPPLRILSLKASFGWESVKMTVCPQWTLLETEVMSCPVPRFLLSEVLCGL